MSVSKDVKKEFYKLDAFLDFYSDDNGTFSIDIIRLINLISSNIPELTWNVNHWADILFKISPLLKNVLFLLENKEFRISQIYRL